jgi:hypothetical protein
MSELRGLPVARAAILLYLAGIAAGEAVLAFVSVQVGLIIEALLLTTLVNHYTFCSRVDERASDALVVLALIPLARLASFVLPQAAFRRCTGTPLSSFQFFLASRLPASWSMPSG